jgi:signal transduction histidine kinase
VFAATLRRHGISSAVGAPIVVAGRLWGVVIAGSEGGTPFPAGTETRIGEFTELVATAIANADGRAKLAESRARIVAASDDARRRFERNLHDGAQQQLVSLGLQLRMLVRTAPDDLRAAIGEVATGLNGVVADLQEISRGLHPAILSHGGLADALVVLARRSPVPVEVDADVPGRLPERVEVAAYYVVSEALANAAKHAGASVVRIEAALRDGVLELAIRDDGVGGADPALGSGLIGLVDRVEAIGGTIEVASPSGAGTALLVRLPLG